MGGASLDPAPRRTVYSAAMSDAPFDGWEPTTQLSLALQRIGADNDRFRAFVALADREQLGQQAIAAKTRRAEGRALSPIDGVAVGVKDNIDTTDLPTACGSAMYADRLPSAEATVVTRLRAAGALLVGKTNLTELACGTEGRNAHFGDVVNPTVPDRFPGGSSSGSAAAVAASMVPLAVGSDTSCSIRNPAAACGVVGLKPTFDRVPTDGVSVCSKRLDHVGPMADSTVQAAALLSVLQDPAWSDPLVDLATPPVSLRIGLLTGPFARGCEPVVDRAMVSISEALTGLGHEVTEVDLGLDLAETDGQVNVLCREMLAIYGSDVDQAPTELVSAEVRHWFSHYAQQTNAEYQSAVSFQEMVRQRVALAFQSTDVLLCPTARALPALVAGAEGNRADRAQTCSVWNLAGTPSLNLPVTVDSGHAPVGVLLNGPHGADGPLLALGASLESTLGA